MQLQKQNLKKKNQEIFSKDWLAFHPYHPAASTDLYYIRLANKIFSCLEVAFETETDEKKYISPEKEAIKELSCILTAYLEDVVSGTRIFKAFTAEHQKRYGSPLPYCQPKDYADDEINPEDVSFLIWHYLVQAQGEGTPLSPVSQQIGIATSAAMELLDEAYETAPENQKLIDFLTISKQDTTLAELYERFFWLGTESYLFFADGQELQQTIEDVVSTARQNNDDIDMESFISIVCNDFAYNLKTELFGLRPAQWLALILGEKHPLYTDLMNLSEKYAGYFIYVSENQSAIRIRHMASGQEIEVNKKSAAGFPKELKENECILHLNFVKWKNEWHLIGRISGYEKNEELLKRITGSDDEINLFAEKDEHLSIEVQEKKLQEYLDNVQEQTEPEQKNDLLWQAVTDPDISSNTIKEALSAGRISDWQFPDDSGSKRLTDNLEFTLCYFKGEC